MEKLEKSCADVCFKHHWTMPTETENDLQNKLVFSDKG